MLQMLYEQQLSSIIVVGIKYLTIWPNTGLLYFKLCIFLTKMSMSHWFCNAGLVALAMLERYATCLGLWTVSVYQVGLIALGDVTVCLTGVVLVREQNPRSKKLEGDLTRERNRSSLASKSAYFSPMVHWFWSLYANSCSTIIQKFTIFQIKFSKYTHHILRPYSNETYCK